MILSSLQSISTGAAPMIANHVWQSTLFAAALAAVTLAFRKNQARVRFGLWLAASLKFLIPFSLLIGFGSRLALPQGSVSVQTGLYFVMEQVSQPFTRTAAPAVAPVARMTHLLSPWPGVLALTWLGGLAAVTGLWWVRWRRVSASMRRAAPQARGREVDALRQVERVAGVRRPIPFLVSRDSMEPGIFGIARPVLIWPEGISEHLEDEHLKAILAHEVCHVRRRDNLAAAVHMLIEGIFWFHPLVWWLGARLIEERERACDEEVLGLGSEPELYAEGILKACKFCVESPLSCVSGVSGSNLKRRIVRIMNQQLGNKLSIGGKALLAALGIAAIAIPVAIGLSNPRQARAQEPQAAAVPSPAFDMVSIKPSASADEVDQIQVEPNAFTETHATVKSLLEFAYGVKDYQLIGAPDWIGTDRFDVEARWKAMPGAETADVASAAPPPPLPPPPGVHATMMRMGVTGAKMRFGLAQAMVQKLLAERFNLKLRHESRDLPVYDLVVAGSGAKLTEAPATPPPATPGEKVLAVRVGFKSREGELELRNGSAEDLAGFLSQHLDHKVLDKTGLKGRYEIALHWSQGENAGDIISAALEDQLGLRLESQQAAVDVLVIDQVERPAAD